ncbi:hypothetical protein QE152_g10225 [Popillia japonica]|uniref:Uncharacterized protein n=1 Tax=Popillia japonica TaxID=7064 RepID=A0AAW1LVN2_POPJA
MFRLHNKRSDNEQGRNLLGDQTTNEEIEDEVITSRDVIFLETKPANIEEIEDVQSILTDSLSKEANNENEEDPNDASNVPERVVTQPTEVHDERNVPERNVRRSSRIPKIKKSDDYIYVASASESETIQLQSQKHSCNYRKDWDG